VIVRGTWIIWRKMCPRKRIFKFGKEAKPIQIHFNNAVDAFVIRWAYYLF
jgi:hypothetical protein